MKKLLSVLLGAFLVPVVAFSTVAADSPGQLQNSDNFYKVKNETKGGSYAKSVSATCGDVVKYSIMIANGEYGMLSNVKVKTTLSGATTVSATNAAGQTTSTSGSVSVSVTGGSLQYVTGSTKNLAENGTFIKNLADGITTTGVNKGSLTGSTAEFVQFQAKVECKEEPKNIKVCELATKQVITIKENEFDSAKHSKNLNDCKKEVPGKITVCELATKTVVTINEGDFDAKKHSKDLNDCEEAPVETPQVIAATGPAGTIASMFGLSALTAGIGYAVQRRRNILG
ncbi:TPA: hypothetical protein DCF80_01255 [Candidatus Saccharibacteria bacterium]|nr:hypothetical protein [Candidatus Saccharibacteria bacterium]HRK40665.1 hypothetical protein [Candidatus Saccharibacteria bacterium]